MANLNGVKVGDEVAIATKIGRYTNRVRLVKVTKVTPTMLVTDWYDYRFYRASGREVGGRSFCRPATDADRKEEAERAAAEKAKDDRLAEAERIRQADPKTPYIDRLKGNADYHPWERLTVEQLRQVCEWLWTE